MSTRIETAFRCRTPQLNAVLGNLQQQLLRAAAHRLSLLLGDKEPELEAIHRLLGSEEDLSCGIRVYVHGSYAYLLPWGIESQKVRRPRLAQDFAYWNSTDKPKGVRRAEWKRRGATWESILDSAPCLYCDIIRTKKSGEVALVLRELLADLPTKKG